MSPRARQWRERTQERRWTECDVPSCDKFVHALSRFCNRHHHHATRYGSPTAPIVRRSDVKPYERIARRLLTINRNHRAIKLTCNQLDEMLATAARTDHGRPSPKRTDVEGKLRRELARLHADGITGGRVLSLCAALHFYARINPGVVGLDWLGTRRHRFAIARHVLHHTQRKPHGASKRLPALSARVLDRCGERLINATEALLTAMESAYARQSSTSQL